MTKHINLQKNYSENSDGYQLKLPLNIETIILEDDSVCLASIKRHMDKQTNEMSVSEIIDHL